MSMTIAMISTSIILSGILAEVWLGSRQRVAELISSHEEAETDAHMSGFRAGYDQGYTQGVYDESLRRTLDRTPKS